MMKRPKPGETEEDILRMQQEFLKEKAKNPKMQASAKIVKIEKAPRQSLFAKNRTRPQEHVADAAVVSAKKLKSNAAETETTKQVLGEIQEKKFIDPNNGDNKNSDIVLGDIVEKQFSAPKPHNFEKTALEASAFPKVEKMSLLSPQPGKSIFALSMASKAKAAAVPMEVEAKQTEPMESEPIDKRHLTDIYGSTSVIVEDAATAGDVHKENLQLLSQMKNEEIMAERRNLLESIDPTLVALLAKRRQERTIALKNKTTKAEQSCSGEVLNVNAITPMETESEEDVGTALPPSNAAVDILQRSSAEQWIHFDVVEKDKLEWLREIPEQTAKLKPGEKFEARFDWKGVLLPYSTSTATTLKTDGDQKECDAVEKDERELYLHGDEPQRAGYTLQELFRLARSNIMQQRVSAFGAIAGILNIYNQGFYDDVLELPISKIFFLLRFGLDDNTPAMLEVVTKALAFLFYNETDEALLDFIYDNPGCHWQPTLRVLSTDSDDSDPTSIENLQKQMKQMQVNASARVTGTASISANIEESEEESKTSMTDFQLAETDLIDCLLRTNILQRIYFILKNVRPDNSTVSSCLKLLIRLARTGKEVATQIVKNDDLINCLWDNFLPGLERVDTTLQMPSFFNYPQYLCLKLVRVLISQNLGIALKFVQHQNLIDKLLNYLFNREDIKGKLIKTQIESLRILRCLLILTVDHTLYKKFLPAFRYMLEWHYNHVVYEVGGPYLIRQHAAALLAAITSGSGGLEVHSLLGDILHDCCCNWFHRATQNGVKEFSQTTLLSACLDAVTWYTRNTNDPQRFRKFSEKYLRDFVTSGGFEKFINSLITTSVILRSSNDRRNVHPPLPNVGAIVLHKCGPQLLLSQTYAVPLLNALWRLLELQLTHSQKALFDVILKPQIVEPIVKYLRAFAASTASSTLLATNFYAKTEVKFIFKLLCFEGLSGVYFAPTEMLHLVYKFLCCLTAEHIPEIEQLFERVIFNKVYIDVDEETLTKWRTTCLELVYPHYIVVSPTELTLSIPHTQAPILSIDWPYFQLKIILQNYIENVQQKPTGLFSEREVLRMTLNFVAQLEQSNPHLQMVTPTEKLMYLMIAFMGPDSQFLEADIRDLLRQHVLRFYKECSEHTFQFDAVYEGKCKFENLYALFVDHFQAASYGDELFGSLVLLPLAQKYDNKWRRRVWSDYAAALRFLDCDESLLLGGLKAYLEPVEQEESLLHAYAVALNTNLVRPNTIPHKIAKYHIDKCKEINLK